MSETVKRASLFAQSQEFHLIYKLRLANREVKGGVVMHNGAIRALLKNLSWSKIAIGFCNRIPLPTITRPDFPPFVFIYPLYNHIEISKYREELSNYTDPLYDESKISSQIMIDIFLFSSIVCYGRLQRIYIVFQLEFQMTNNKIDTVFNHEN